MGNIAYYNHLNMKLTSIRNRELKITHNSVSLISTLEFIRVLQTAEQVSYTLIVECRYRGRDEVGIKTYLDKPKSCDALPMMPTFTAINPPNRAATIVQF